MNKVREITLVALLTAILFIQEELLSFIPNVQLTVFLLVLYSKKIGFKKTSIIIIIHVLLDNLVLGSFSFYYTPTMFIGWMFIPVIICLFCKKVESPIALGFIGIGCSFFYCWCFLFASIVLLNVNPCAYFVSDILWEIILAACSFLTIMWLYKPCSNLFDKYYLLENEETKLD